MAISASLRKIIKGGTHRPLADASIILQQPIEIVYRRGKRSGMDAAERERKRESKMCGENCFL